MENKDWIEFFKSKIPELKRIYKEKTGKELDLDNCRTLTEKIQWLKIYDSNPLIR